MADGTSNQGGAMAVVKVSSPLAEAMRWADSTAHLRERTAMLHASAPLAERLAEDGEVELARHATVTALLAPLRERIADLERVNATLTDANRRQAAALQRYIEADFDDPLVGAVAA